MSPKISSKERILGAINYEEIDYIPCEFMLFFNLTNKFPIKKEAVYEEIKMGLDAMVNVGTLENSFHPETKYNEWIEEIEENKYYFRKLETPKGPLTQKVIQRNNWPNNDFFPIFDDFIVPRAKEVLLKAERDLEKLKYLLGPPSGNNIKKLKETASESKKIAAKYGLLQVAGEVCRNLINERCYSLIAGADMMSWLSGFEDIMALSLTKPEIIQEYMNFISDWNRQQIEIYLEVTDVDLIVRRGWYESTEFWTPDAYRRFIVPNLKKEADLVHRSGKKFGYILTSAFLPILDDILHTGIDLLIGLDPREGKGTDIDKVKEKFLTSKKALWGGVSGPLTVENGSEKDTEKAVIEALKTLGKGGGFILSPVDNVREETKDAWKNTFKFIETWKKYRDNYKY
jgi:hypothetical protein